MVTIYGSQNTEDIPDTQDSTPVDLMLQDHPVQEGDNYSSDEQCEESYTHHPLAELLQQFQQFKNQLASLKSNTQQCTPTEELLQFTDKLQHLTMVLQPAPQSSEEPVHKSMQVYTETLHAMQRESNLTTTMLQDIPTFDGQDSSKFEDWFMDIETAIDILTESHTHLDKNHFC